MDSTNTAGETHVTCQHCGAPNGTGVSVCGMCKKPMPVPPPQVPKIGATIASPNPTLPEKPALAQFGWLLFAAGVVGMVVGLLLGTTVQSAPTYVYGQSVGGDSVHNIGMIATKLGVLIVSGFVTVSGAVLVSASAQNDAARLLRFSIGRQVKRQ